MWIRNIGFGFVVAIAGMDDRSSVHSKVIKYAGTMKGHNICKRHVAINTGVKQTEQSIFSTLLQWN